MMQRRLCISDGWRPASWKRKFMWDRRSGNYLYTNDDRRDISNVTAMASLHLTQPHLRQPSYQPSHQPPRAHQSPSAFAAATAPPSQPPSQPPPPVQAHRPSDTATPLTAPQPMRAAVAPPSVPTPGIWSPEMGIRFGSAGAPPGATVPTGTIAPGGQPGRAQTGPWDPNQGIRFA